MQRNGQTLKSWGVQSGLRRTLIPGGLAMQGRHRFFSVSDLGLEPARLHESGAMLYIQILALAICIHMLCQVRQGFWRDGS